METMLNPASVGVGDYFQFIAGLSLVMKMDKLGLSWAKLSSSWNWILLSVYLVLNILNISLGRFNFVDSILQFLFGKFGSIDLVCEFGLVPKEENLVL